MLSDEPRKLDSRRRSSGRGASLEMCAPDEHPRHVGPNFANDQLATSTGPDASRPAQPCNIRECVDLDAWLWWIRQTKILSVFVRVPVKSPPGIAGCRASNSAPPSVSPVEGKAVRARVAERADRLSRYGVHVRNPNPVGQVAAAKCDLQSAAGVGPGDPRIE